MSNKPITNDLRKKVTEKFITLLPMLQLNNTAEAIESTCFEKSENNAETYMKICQNFISNRSKQLEIGRVSANQNYRPNMANTSNNGTASDPINALQNLTVTAGQPGQINIHQATQQQQQQQQQQHMSIRMNNPMFNPQIHQRAVMPVTLQSGNMQRPMDQFPMSQSPTTQILQPQMQQVHAINSLNMANSNNIRLIAKNPLIQQNQGIPVTYQLDNNNIAQMPGQQMSNMVPQTVVRPQIARIITNSPMPTNQVSLQPQVQQEQQQQQPQQPAMKPNPIKNIQPPEECSSQPSTNSQINANINVNINNNGTNSNTSTNAVSNNAAPQNTPNNETVKTEEEAIKTKEELARLSDRYMKTLKTLIQNPTIVPDDQMKVWRTLSSLLEEQNPLQRTVTLKHILRIQELCAKAEAFAQVNNLDKFQPIVVSKTEETFGKRVIPDRNRPPAALADISTVNLELTGLASNVNNSLDAAFDDVIHQLKKKDAKMMKRIQKNLVKFVRNNRPNCLHYLPRNLQLQEEESSDTDGARTDANYDEHEFDCIDEQVLGGADRGPSRGQSRVLDQHGLLRTDIEPNHEFIGLQSELELIKSEFEVQEMCDQHHSARWCTKDDIWDRSTFLSVTYRNENLPAQVPALYLRVPEDYQYSSTVDWCLNLEMYSQPALSEIAFLDDVRCAVEYEFGDLAMRSRWSGVGLLKALSVYKRGIQTGCSNYQCRKAIA